MNFPILHWSYRDLKEIPREVLEAGDLLEEIYLKENFIESLPMWLFDLKNLKFINIQGNLISEIPQQICLLQNLEFLDLSRNRIGLVPVTVFKLKNLKCLNLSENYISDLPHQVGELEDLEVLDISKNSLLTVPNELAKCCNLIELNLSANSSLKHIPYKVFGLQKLVLMNFDDCGLRYLPYFVGSRLIHARVFQNLELTHIPVQFQIFIQSWMENIPINIRNEPQRNGLLKVYSESIRRWLNLPYGVTAVFKRLYRVPASLFELSLRKFYSSFWGYVMEILLSDQIPFLMLEYIRAGPIGHCNNMYCTTPLFRECYFSVFHRQHSQDLVFSTIFCSKECFDVWYRSNGAMYKEIEWN